MTPRDITAATGVLQRVDLVARSDTMAVVGLATDFAVHSATYDAMADFGADAVRAATDDAAEDR